MSEEKGEQEKLLACVSFDTISVEDLCICEHTQRVANDLRESQRGSQMCRRQQISTENPTTKVVAWEIFVSQS